MDGRPLAQEHAPEEGTRAMAACLSDPVVRRGESDPFDLIELAPAADHTQRAQQGTEG